MKTILTSGESVEFIRCENGYWRCPVCGSPEHESVPYLEDGSGSFQICSCGFEFGFDDTPSACGTTIKSVVGNWEYWRKEKMKYRLLTSKKSEEMKSNLKSIGVEIDT